MKFKSQKTISAAELAAQLDADPEFVRQKSEREARQAEMEARLRAEQKPLLMALADVGVRVNSVWDLVNSKGDYFPAIPVLVTHLQMSYHPKIREGIARALTIRQARGVAGKVILAELKSQTEENREVRWALANALTETADIGMTEEIRKLIADFHYEDVHDVLKLALQNLSAQK